MSGLAFGLGGLGLRSSTKTCCSTSATTASTSAAMNAQRTPSTSPCQAISSPPTTGPSAMGMRRTSECIETPMVRFLFGSTAATRLMVAGSEMAVQERNKTAPRITAHQAGMKITTR